MVYLTAAVDVTAYQGKTAVFKADVLNTTNSPISLQLNDGSGGDVGYVQIPSGTSMDTFTCTLQIKENIQSITGIISITGNVNQEVPIFTDNWRVITQ